MAYWQYLTTEAYASRLMLAAGYVKGCPIIIELGGYKTPITPFLSYPFEKSINLDPLTESYSDEKTLFLPIDYREYDFSPYMKKDFALVMMRMEIPYSQVLHNLVCSAKIIVIDYPVNHKVSLQLLDDILLRADLRKKIHLKMDLSCTPLELSKDSFPPYPQRESLVLEPGL